MISGTEGRKAVSTSVFAVGLATKFKTPATACDGPGERPNLSKRSDMSNGSASPVGVDA